MQRTGADGGLSFFLLGETLTTAGLIGAGIILFCIVAETLIDAHGDD